MHAEQSNALKRVFIQKPFEEEPLKRKESLIKIKENKKELK